MYSNAFNMNYNFLTKPAEKETSSRFDTRSNARDSEDFESSEKHYGDDLEQRYMSSNEKRR
jgi:hypothetical protein